jgi:antitoxin component YwqK of YwqJK toxin-antitoxin module
MQRIPDTQKYSYWERDTAGQLQEEGYYIFDDYGVRKRDSIWKFYNEKNNIWEIAAYCKGFQTGTTRRYYDNGRLRDEISYYNNWRNGPFKTWYENGQINTQGYYRRDRQDSLYTEWYPDGRIKSQQFFRNYKPHGLQAEWYENGQKKSEQKFINGLPDSLFTIWYSNGIKKESREYQNYNMSKHWTWDSTGILRSFADIKNETVTYLDEKGVLVSKQKIDGSWKMTFYPDGKKSTEEIRDDSNRVWYETRWYENGRIKMKTTSNYKGRDMVEYLANARKITECHFTYATYLRDCKYWDEKGRPTNTPNARSLMAEIEPEPQSNFESVREEASFPGGEQALNKYFQDRLVQDMEEIEYEGFISATFTVKEDGRIEDIRITSSQCAACSEALKRALSNMPKWLPTRENGHRIDSVQTFTFRFTTPD